VTQFALLLVLSLLGLLFSFGFGRLEVKRGAVAATVKRVEGALERASVVLLRLGALRGLTLLAVPGVGLATFALFGGGRAGVSNIGRAAFMVVALLGGAVSALVQARFALGLGTRAASSATAAAARGSSRAIRPLIRAAAAIAVFGEALGLLGCAAAFASLYAVRGGFAAAGANAELAAEVVKLLPAYALGAAVTALSLSREGSVAATAARVGGGRAGEPGALVEAGEARDPALLAELVGTLVGELLPRALTSYVCGICATLSAALLAVSGIATATSALSGVGTLRCLLVVVLVRIFGAIGSVCGVLAARASDEEAPIKALFRAQASALVVALFGLGAALFWLEREHLAPLFAAGALGLLTMALVGLLSWLPLRRGATRELVDARNSGGAATIARGASSGLLSLWPVLVVPALGLALLERTLSPAAPSGLLLVTFAAGALALCPLALALAGFSFLATHARGVATLARLEPSVGRRGSRLDDAGTLGGAVGATHASLGLALSLVLGLLSLGSNDSPAPPTSLGLAGLSMLTGVALVLFFGARATQSAVTGARLVSVEVEHQLHDLPRQQGTPVVPADFTPSYKACVDAALAAAKEASVVELALLLVAPLLLGLLLHWGAAAATASPLAGFGIAAVFGGLIVSLGGRATRAVLGELRRRLRSGDTAPATSAATEAEAFGELVGVTAAYSVEAFALVLALTVLCLAPLLR
jgi:Na+/H+-translocating membrane pyrophosphatase